MASVNYEIRWIDESKRYGLFATKDILPGTRILRELAVMLDTCELMSIIRFWDGITTEELSLHPTTKSNLEAQTRDVLKGMQNLSDTVKNSPKHYAAMKLHQTQMTEDVATANPQISMSLYRRIINTNVITGSDEVLTALLQKPIRKINTYLRGALVVHDPTNHAWGPNTSFLNHACKPKAMVTCFRAPEFEDPSLGHLGLIALHALTSIEKDQEITIEYSPVFGRLDARRQELQAYGIASCQCFDCEREEKLGLQPAGTQDSKTLKILDTMNMTLRTVVLFAVPRMAEWKPVASYRAIFQTLKVAIQLNYCGWLVLQLWQTAVRVAKKYNDNVRVYWFATHLRAYIINAYSEDHTMYRQIDAILNATLEGTIWNQENSDLLTLCRTYAVVEADVEAIFMLDRSIGPDGYHLLTISEPEGRLIATTRQENLARVHEARVSRQLQLQLQSQAPPATQQDHENEKATALERADEAAASLAAEEEKEAAKKEKLKRKKKEKAGRAKAKKRAAKEEEEKERAAAAAAIEAALAARIDAVRRATVVPALPRPRPAPVAAMPPPTRAPSPPLPSPPPPSPPPHHRHFRSSSNPEAATVTRFLAGEPLRPPPSAFEDEDCVSESGMVIRFGVSIRKEVKWEYLGWYLAK